MADLADAHSPRAISATRRRRGCGSAELLPTTMRYRATHTTRYAYDGHRLAVSERGAADAAGAALADAGRIPDPDDARAGVRRAAQGLLRQRGDQLHDCREPRPLHHGGDQPRGRRGANRRRPAADTAVGDRARRPGDARPARDARGVRVRAGLAVRGHRSRARRLRAGQLRARARHRCEAAERPVAPHPRRLPLRAEGDAHRHAASWTRSRPAAASARTSRT